MQVEATKPAVNAGKTGLFSRLRRGRRSKGTTLSTATSEVSMPVVVTPDKRELASSPVQESVQSSRESVPDSPTPKKRVTLANPQSIPIAKGKNKVPQRETITLTRTPTAKEAAFKGPPRYDWIDIVRKPKKMWTRHSYERTVECRDDTNVTPTIKLNCSKWLDLELTEDVLTTSLVFLFNTLHPIAFPETAAAIKVQSNFRRCKVMTDLEKQGLSTAAIRNRSRRREVKHEMTGSEDIPSLLACCGVGLAFGDATEEDNEARRAYQKELYEQRKKEREEKEEKLRNQFMSKQLASKRENDVEESYEVVE